MENLQSYGVFQSCQKGISKINITGTSNVLFWHFRMPEKVGMFFCWGDEWRAQHVMRCGKIVSKKSPPQGGCRWKGTTFGGPILEEKQVIRSRHKNWKNSQPCRKVDSKKFYKNSRGVIFWYKNRIQSEAYCWKMDELLQLWRQKREWHLESKTFNWFILKKGPSSYHQQKHGETGIEEMNSRHDPLSFHICLFSCHLF